MTDRLQYGATTKVFHWLVVALLIVQFPIGWLMPDIRGDMKPGNAMTLHVSFGITILGLIVLRFVLRLTHPVAPESSLPPPRVGARQNASRYRRHTTKVAQARFHQGS